MGLFSVRRKVSAADYWRLRLAAILCAEPLDELARDAPPPIAEALAAADRDLATRELRAVCVCLASIAIAKLWPRRLALSATLTHAAIMNKECPDLAELESVYSSAFGSSFTDGVAPMAALFVHRAFPAGTSPALTEFYYDAFYEQLKARCQDWETMRLVE